MAGTAPRIKPVIVPMLTTGTYTAFVEGALVEMSSTDMTVQMPAGAAPTTPLFGLVHRAPEGTGLEADIVIGGIFPGIAGDTSITAGGLYLTAEGTDGKLKAAAPSTGVNCGCIGISLAAAAAEDVRVPVLVIPGLMKQG